MKKKMKNIKKIISSLLLFIIIFFLLLLIKSADWFLDNFGGVTFATVVYQLFSPMKGTPSEILNNYCDICLYPSVFCALLFLLFYNMYNVILKKLILEFDICFLQKELRISLGNRFRIISKSLVLGLFLLTLCFLVWNRAVVIGVPGYIQSISESSLLYEEEYVDPQDVSIEFPQQKRNLLLIYLESMETTFASTDVGGGKPINYIPGLTLLANENLYFSDDSDLGGIYCYSSTGWTIAGLLASSSGVNYKLPIFNEADDYENFLPGLTAMGDILEDTGYQNYFMCGSEAVFAGRADYYSQHGNYHIIDYYNAIEDGVIPTWYREFWGIEDQNLYEYVKQKLTEVAASGEPFNFTMLTSDTHHPNGYVCTLCENEYSEQYANVLACADKQVCQFIEWVKEQDWYENTTIVIMGDHNSMKSDFWDDIGSYQRKTYNCFINLPEGLTARQTTDREISAMDMFPTILAAIGANIEGERLGLGTNLFSDKQTLAEQMGSGEFDRQLNLFSKYYYSNFIIADR